MSAGTEETRELIRRSQEGDLEARSRLVEENLPLVKSIAARFVQRGIDYEDLVQIGSIGLLKAVRDIELNSDVRVTTYAEPKIMGEIKQQLRRASPLRVARSLRQLASQAISAKDVLSVELGRTPTIKEIADRLGAPVEEVVAALEAVQPITSLQTAIDPGEDDSLELGDFIASPTNEDHVMLKQALESLEPLERKIILLRYFAEKSQTEIAEELGVSQAQISRIEARIVRRLRHEI